MQFYDLYIGLHGTYHSINIVLAFINGLPTKYCLQNSVILVHRDIVEKQQSKTVSMLLICTI